MVNTNKEWISKSDRSIVSSIGEYLKQQRLNQNKTQAKVAEIAGVNRWTLSKIENGEPVSLITLIQILRALDLLNLLSIFETSNTISPLELAKLEKQKRLRASSENQEDKQEESEW